MASQKFTFKWQDKRYDLIGRQKCTFKWKD